MNKLNNVPLFADLSGSDYPLLQISPSSLPFDDYPTESSNNLINSNTLFMIISGLSANIYKNSENINTISAAINNSNNILQDIKKDINTISAAINNSNNNIDNNILQNMKKDIYSISAAINNKIENIVVDNNKLLANFIQIQKNNSTITLSMPTYIPTGIIEIIDNGIYDYNMYATKQCSAAIALTENNY